MRSQTLDNVKALLQLRWVKIFFKLARQLTIQAEIYGDELLNPHWILYLLSSHSVFIGLITLFFFLSLVSITLFFI